MEDRTGLVIYGSTGSIGVQTLNVVNALKGRKKFEVVGLVCNSDIETLEWQILEHKPRVAVVIDATKAEQLAFRLEGRSDTMIGGGEEAALALCGAAAANLVVVATVGFSGLSPTLIAISNHKNVALANKETLVTAGPLVMKQALLNGVEIFPIDSEHSAIWQALEPALYDSVLGKPRHTVIHSLAKGNVENPIEKIILTASGGPFRNLHRQDLRNVSVEDALNHPTWRMGGRITIDSATLMNKGFELIEAMVLFKVAANQVEIVVHPQSIMHSGVRLVDGNEIMVQSLPNMEMPIQYAITWPERLPSDLPRLSLPRQGELTFQQVDTITFGCLELATKAAYVGGTLPAVLNGADEAAVDLFLKGRVGFLDIERLVRGAIEDHTLVRDPTVSQIRAADAWAREHVHLEHSDDHKNGGARRRARA